MKRRALLVSPALLAGCATGPEFEERTRLREALLAMPDQTLLPLQLHPPLAMAATQPGQHLAAWPVHTRLPEGARARFRGRWLAHEDPSRIAFETRPGVPGSQPDRLAIDGRWLALPMGLQTGFLGAEIAELAGPRWLWVVQAHGQAPLWLCVVDEQGQVVLDWRRPPGEVRLQPRDGGFVFQHARSPARWVRA